MNHEARPTRRRSRRRPPGAALALAAVWLAGGLASGAAAEPDPAPADGDGDWKLSLALYSWISDVTGEATAGDVSLDVEPQLWNDIIRNLDFALFGAAEALYRDRWIVNLDLNLIRLSPEQEKGPYTVGFGPASFERRLGAADLRVPVETRLGDLEVPVRVQPGTLRVDVPRVEATLGPIDIETRLTQVTARGLLGYRALDVPLQDLLGGDRDDDPRRLRVDLMAGIRYYYAKTEIDIDSPPVKVPSFRVTSSLSGGRVRVGDGRFSRSMPLGRIELPDLAFDGATLYGIDVDEESSSWWIDPVLGVRVGADVSERLSVALMGNVGGFGIGSASDFSWETILVGTFALGDHWSLGAGYRALGYDRGSGGMELDLITHGPLVGFLYRF